VVRDIDRMLAFYRDALGLPMERKLDFPGMQLWCLSTGAGTLKLAKTDEAQESANPPGGYATATGLRYISLEVDDPHERADAASDAGGTTQFKLDMPGITLALVDDPEGNQVELMRWHSAEESPSP
jgi:catechol 2,3-dioxygenase-like lactoylglutathione lyase family enzyme